MGKKIAIIGLIGGILVVAGVFGTWITNVGSLSGWDLTKATGEGGLGARLPYVTLIGGILAVIGALLALWAKPSVIPAGLLAIGGILALIGVAFGLVVADVGLLGKAMGYGGILVVVGGILAILVTLGLKEEPYKAEGWLKG